MTEKWDYKTVNPSKSYAGVEILAEDPESELNNIGDKGWELVSTIEESIGKTKYLVFQAFQVTLPNPPSAREFLSSLARSFHRYVTCAVASVSSHPIYERPARTIQTPW